MAGLILLTVLSLLSLAGTATSSHYYIVPNTSIALCQHYPVDTCFTLEEFSSHVSDTENGNITISFLNGEHHLTWNMMFNGSDHIIFNREVNGSTIGRPRINCLQNAGLDFMNLCTLTISGLEIRGCESDNNGGAISVRNVKHVYMKECQLTDNQLMNGYGGGAIYLENVTALIQSSTFSNNSCMFGYGGAIYFERSIVSIDSCSFELNKAGIGGALNTQDVNSAVVTLNITNTIFFRNSAGDGGAIDFLPVQGGSMIISNCLFMNNSATGHGGAVYVSITMLNSSGNVYSGNSGSWGGALYSSSNTTAWLNQDYFSNNEAQNGATIYHIDEATLHVSNCTFIGNWPTDKSSDSDIVYITGTSAKFRDVSFLNNHGSLFSFNSHVEFCGNTTFRSNIGKLGGAITSTASVITFENASTTQICGNTASYGGGLYIDQSTMYIYGSMQISENRARVSGGGIHAFQTGIEFRSKYTVEEMELFKQDLLYTEISKNAANNDGGGVYLTASSLKVYYSQIQINSNTAKQNGGGMFLEQNSKVELNKQVPDDPMDVFLSTMYVRLEFTHNSAIRGGGVYMSDSSNSGVLCKGANSLSQTNLSSRQCFLQTLKLYTDHVTAANPIDSFFNNNTASESGSDIYGGLLDRCTINPIAEILSDNYPPHQNFSGLEYFNATVTFNWAKRHNPDTSDFYNHISSDPVRVCFCKGEIIHCNSTYHMVFTKKGESFTFNAVALDQVGRPVNATLISSLILADGQVGRLKEGQQVMKIENRCTKLVYNVYSTENTATLQLYADGPCGNQGISKREVNITFQPCKCPIGLERYPPLIDCFCDCDRRIKSHVSKCSPANGTIQINTNVWIEYENTTNTTGFITPHCPYDYCVRKPVNISLASQTKRDQQCAFNRTGRMCGKCEEGLSQVFASSRCWKCSNYYLFLLFPFALAGIALVIFILFLNMTVATGTIHGLIFFANMLVANRFSFLPFNTPNFLTVFISWLNLDLGIETCFYDGMSSYAKLLLQLVFPFYIFLIVAIIILLCDRSQRISALISKRNPEATLYTLILLSYSKLIRTIITALQYITIDYPDETQKIFWLYDANVFYFSVSHIPRFFAASIIVTLGTVYTTLLLFGQLFNRFSQYRLMKWTNHRYYTHFIKAHHAPLSDKHRYWVGLLLLARLNHYLISAFTTESIVILSAGTTAFVLILLKQLNEQIYNTRALDLLETSFLANLVVLALSALYIREESGNQQVLAYISLTIYFITFLGIVLYHIGILDKCRIMIQGLPQRIQNAFRQRRLYERAPSEGEDQEELPDEDDMLLDIDEMQNYTDGNGNDSNDSVRYRTQPIIRYAVPDDQLREPALDDLIPIQPEDYAIPPPPQRQRHRDPVTFAEIDIRANQEENN